MDILIVEDEANIALDLESKLKEMNYNVVGITDNYEEALRLAREIKISLALLDINIVGEKTGVEIAHIFREKFNIPCIFLPTFSNNLIINKANELSAYKNIVKPYSQKDISSAFEIAKNLFTYDPVIAERNSELEKLVAERTKDLIKINQRLEEEMEYTLKLQGDVLEATNLERKRITQELHDGISQKLTASKYALIAMAKSLQLEVEWNNLFQEVILMIEESMHEIRNISHQLIPTEVAKSGLPSVLKAMFNRLNQLKIVQANLIMGDDFPTINISLESAIYRIIQELVNNTIKHADATTINLVCLQKHRQIIFIYRDNGKGFDMAKKYKQGIGLKNIYDRALSIGAKLKAKSVLDEGTTYKLIIKT